MSFVVLVVLLVAVVGIQGVSYYRASRQRPLVLSNAGARQLKPDLSNPTVREARARSLELLARQPMRQEQLPDKGKVELYAIGYHGQLGEEIARRLDVAEAKCKARQRARKQRAS